MQLLLKLQVGGVQILHLLICSQVCTPCCFHFIPVHKLHAQGAQLCLVTAVLNAGPDGISLHDHRPGAYAKSYKTDPADCWAPAMQNLQPDLADMLQQLCCERTKSFIVGMMCTIQSQTFPGSWTAPS